MRVFVFGICMAVLMNISLYGLEDESKPYSSFPELHGPCLGQTLPGDVPEIFCAGFLKPPEGFHSSVTFSPDMREAYWTSMRAHTFCSKLENGVWTAPAEIRFDSACGIGEVVLSSDGNRLYFLSRKTPETESVERERIWYCDRLNGSWLNPLLVDKTVNTHPTHWQFSFADNGNLYFTSQAEGTGGGADIYMARWDGNRFLAPVDLGTAINTDLRDFTPFVARDESYLIFARSVPEENNRSDLFISFRDAAGGWTKAINMGDTINSLHNEVCPRVTPDGKYLFFASISGERNDVYWVSTDIIGALKERH